MHATSSSPNTVRERLARIHLSTWQDSIQPGLQLLHLGAQEEVGLVLALGRLLLLERLHLGLRLLQLGHGEGLGQLGPLASLGGIIP